MKHKPDFWKRDTDTARSASFDRLATSVAACKTGQRDDMKNLPFRTLRVVSLVCTALWLSLSGCAASSSSIDRSRTPFVVEYQLALGAAKKSGVQALTNTGAQIFASSTLSERNPGLSSFGGTVSFPQTVTVTWRDGARPGESWASGTVVEHKIDVRARMPAKFFEMAKAAPHRVVKLQFRIKDDRVLFAWCIQEERGGGHVDLLNDGDFQKATLYNGVVTDPGWER